MEPITGRSAVRTKQPNEFPTRNDNGSRERLRIIELIPSGDQLLIFLHPKSPKSKSGDKILISLSEFKQNFKNKTPNTIVGTCAKGRNEKRLEIIQNKEEIYLFIHPEGTYETGWAAITQKATLTQAINELT